MARDYIERQPITISEYLKLSRENRRQVTHRALTKAAQINPVLNSFITILQPDPRGTEGSLAFLPLAVKDIFLTKGIRTTAGSKILDRFVPDYDATAVSLLKMQGAAIVGKTNTHEFAAGATNLNPHFGAVHNPYDLRRISGGSSGGSAVSVASGTSLVALGSDTGGSVRIPASLCGVIGFKPSYGAISRFGVIPLSWSLDHVGTLTRNTHDAKLIFEKILRTDAKDPATTFYRPVKQGEAKLSELTVGVSSAFQSGCEAGVEQNFLNSVDALSKAGCRLRRVRIRHFQRIKEVRSVILRSEMAAYHLATYPGRLESYGEDVKKMIETGADITAPVYVTAQRVRSLIAKEIAELFSELDFLLTPSTRCTAPKIEEAALPSTRTELIANTEPFNITGEPAISLPNGIVAGLPTGIQLSGPYGSDFELLKVAEMMEELLLSS